MALYSELGVLEAAMPIVLNRAETNYGAGGGGSPSTTYNESASDTIEFSSTQTAGIPFERTLSDTIEFSDTLISSLQTPEAEDTVEFSDTTRINVELDLTVSDTVVLSETVITSLQTPSASDTVEFLDFASEGLDQAGAKTAASEDTIEFSDTHVIVKILASATDLSVEDTIEFSDRSTIPFERSISDTIEFSDTAVTDHGKFVEDTIVFSETVVLNRELELTVTDSIRFADFGVWETDAPDLCRYSPSIGSGAGDIPDPPSATVPTLVPVDFVTLFYPTTSPTTIVTLRVPELGNRDRQIFDRINRESRGGTLLIFANPDWPKLTRLALTFTGLKESEGQEVLSFFQDTLGLEIGFTDWESRTWHGVNLSPDEPMVRNSREIRDISFELEVELQ